MREASREIINIKFEGGQTLDECMEQFYEIMRKHGIKQGTPSKNEDGDVVGRSISTPEWVACKTLFLDSVNRYFLFADLLNDVPEDIQ